MDPLAEIAKEWPIVKQVWLTMLVVLGALSGLMFLAFNWRYGGMIESLKERLTNRDERIADYERKFSGATPDEAKARLDALERRVGELGPRRLTDEQRKRLTVLLAKAPGTVQVSLDAAAPESRAFAGDFILAFQQAGWTIQNAMVMGLGQPPPTGIGLRVTDLTDMGPQATALREGLVDIGLNFDLQPGLRLPAPPLLTINVELVITTKII